MGNKSNRTKSSNGNLNLFYLDIGPVLVQLETFNHESGGKRGDWHIRIKPKGCSVKDEWLIRGIDGKDYKRDEEAVKELKVESMKEKDDLCIIFPIRWGERTAESDSDDVGGHSTAGVPRVGIPRPPRASMQDLYDRMGRMEIRQDAIERMKYRQSYHWDRYHGVFEALYGVLVFPG
ncbi:hypothetical protein Tco_1465781 [Tanacetum coccineum]